MARPSTVSPTPEQLRQLWRIYQEGEELGIDWADTWKRVRDWVGKRRPEPGKPGQPLPQLPKVPGPPAWFFYLVVAYLMWRFD